MSDVLLLAAALPPLFLIYRIYQMDAVEHEPIGLIIKLLIAGGAVTVIASLLESALTVLYSGPYLSQLASDLIHYFIVVAIVEELCKYGAARLMTWKDPAFDYTFDGVVYCVTASLGFALVENIMYAGIYGMRTAVIRAFTAIVLHAVCGVFMGCYYGAAKQYSAYGNKSSATKMTARSILVPVVIHGIYDFCASQDSTLFSAIFLVFLVFLYYAAYKRVSALEKNDTPLPGADGDQRGYGPDGRGY